MKATTWLSAGAFVVALALPGSAIAQTVETTADVNMRAGPSTRFPVVTTIPENRQVQVFGCDRNLDWCDVAWRGNRGWVFSEYLEVGDQRRRGPIGEIGRLLGLPFAAFDPEGYWDRHYRDRPWYDERQRWGATGGLRTGEAQPHYEHPDAQHRRGFPPHMMR
jgi:uncharacterized protein YraI